jgi:hypothetical protein
MKAGKDAPVDCSGKGKLMVGPIHDKLGYDAVRINAYAQEQPGDFKASVGIINLSGDWVGIGTSLISNSTTCPSEDGDDSTTAGQGPDMILNLLSAYGVFNRDPADPSGATLKWEQTGTIEGAEGVTIEAKAVVGSDDIKMNWSVDIPKQTSSLFERQFVMLPVEKEHLPSTAPWALASIPTASLVLLLPVKYRRKGFMAVLMISAMCLVLLASGCGLKNIYGTLSGEYVFTKIAYPEKDFSYPPQGDAYWNLTGGTHNATYDIFTEEYINPLDESEGTEEKECVIKISYTLNGTVEKDGLVTPDALKSSSE